MKARGRISTTSPASAGFVIGGSFPAGLTESGAQPEIAIAAKAQTRLRFMLSPQEVVEALQPRARVGQLEQLLLRRKGKRKEFGETGAHPGAGIEPVRRLEEPLALLRDHALEQAHAGPALFRHRRVDIVGKHFDRGAREAAGLDSPAEDAKAPLAAGDDMQHAQLRHGPGGDSGEAADLHRGRRRADFRAIADQAYAEGRVVAQADPGHFHVALLEDPQRQATAGKEHRVQRKKREVLHYACAPSRARPRWRTRTRHCARNASASRSARYTER